ncbi:hypothetical protein GUITHDRAFT_115357 [Guillardia theta CCMP2712]|uniref:LamG-like jellyroll fold domain-containing protein n=1 Tax=Guillardia theta (strain CCMP2712) TaxID=905079 RepID=L1IQL7_GUITC|nr:hypothetical protein GUITHDRAFT_115357 [Guillardia theta CCMP2712]EKX38586.1 hypothetical protein GUITHDRAFT_115357 [Guillardia theta CCMP2712]|eukprot:XP_005825566.1 hypothetical protein GUITHDRAFT_115357 [Guillardia theta CCMP2712]
MSLAVLKFPLCLFLMLVAGAECQELLIHLKFDETGGQSSFQDSSSHNKNADCRLSGASCPRSGQQGAVGLAVYFAASCPRDTSTYRDDCEYTDAVKSYNSLAPGQKTDCFYSNQKRIEMLSKYITQSATCGSAVRFDPVQIHDGTVAMWYKEYGSRDSSRGWDLSLVGGSAFVMGRIGPAHWGGYWCGHWHLALPDGYAGNSLKGWDHLSWHHLAFVFAGDTVVMYLDGSRVLMLADAGSCSKELSFLGKRTVRYDQQGNSVRGVEWSGGLDARKVQDTPGAINNMLKVKEWSTNYLKGLVDDFRVYDRPLTETDIRGIMH